MHGHFKAWLCDVVDMLMLFIDHTSCCRFTLLASLLFICRLFELVIAAACESHPFC